MNKKIKTGIVCAVALLLTIVLLSIVFSKKKDIKEEYLKVFDNRTFIINGKAKKMKDILGDDKIDYYSFVDYGNDSHLEMFVRISGINSGCYIFNLKGKKMYAYLLDESVVSNSYDGYSSFIGDTSGWVKYTIKNNKIHKEYIFSRNSETNKCKYKESEVDCNTIIENEIEFLNSIGEIVENIIYGESVDNLT